MAEQTQHDQHYYGHQQQQHHNPTDAVKSYTPQNTQPSKLVAVLTLSPIGGFLLLLSAITLTATLIGVAVTTPLLVIFSPVVVPAVLTVGLAVTGFMTSGAFGITALSSLTYIVNYVRRMRGGGGGQQIERGAEESAAWYLGQRT